MILPRWERSELTAAKPVLVVGMAKSKNNPEFQGPSFERLAKLAGTTLQELRENMDFVNLVAGHPGRDDGGKYDKPPAVRDWSRVGQRASLLYADLVERPRRHVIGLGGFVRDALTFWWPGSGSSQSTWFGQSVGPGGTALWWSPHPSGTNMWWNDANNLAMGQTFWSRAASVASRAYPIPPKQVSLGVRTAWVRHALTMMNWQWPEGCVDWPFIVPKSRPVALLAGDSTPASQLALHIAGEPRPGPDYQALHSCDRGEHCINPGHLRWGTELENRLDQVERARGSIGKVGLEQANEIIRRFDAFVKELAGEYGVSQAAVKHIAMGKSWNPANWRQLEETN